MSFKLTPEQRAAIETYAPGRPIQIEDEHTERIYWLVPLDNVPSLWIDYLNDQVEVGMQAIAAGEIVNWDLEAMKTRARQAGISAT